MNTEEKKDIISHSVEETETIARLFLEQVISKREPEYNPATVIGLVGNLGAGKTTFTQSLGKILGIAETIQSPTFVLQKNYDTSHSIFKKLVHLDLYRIKNPEELNILHLDDVLSNPSNLVLIEWPENAPKNIYPPYMITISFEFVDENTRRIFYTL